MSLVNVSGKAPTSNTGICLRDEECLKILFEDKHNLCFESRLSDSLSRFAVKYGNSEFDGYTLAEFIIHPAMNHIVGKLMVYLAKFVYKNTELTAIAQKLDDVIDKDQPAYNIYTDYIRKLSNQSRVIILLPNFYEEAAHMSEEDLSLLSMIIDKCCNVKIWICGEDTRDNQRHSIYQRFYDRFDPVTISLFEAIKYGKTVNDNVKVYQIII